MNINVSVIASIILFVYPLIKLGIALDKYGKEYVDDYSLLNLALGFLFIPTLWLSGFFNVFQWPQIAYLTLFLLGLGVHISNFGDTVVEKYGFPNVIAHLLQIFIFSKGGAYVLAVIFLKTL